MCDDIPDEREPPTTTTTTTTTTTEATIDCDTVPVEWHGATNSKQLFKSPSSRLVQVKIPTSDDYPTGVLISNKTCGDLI